MMSISILVEIENGAPKARAKSRVMQKNRLAYLIKLKPNLTKNEAAKKVSRVLNESKLPTQKLVAYATLCQFNITDYLPSRSPFANLSGEYILSSHYYT